MKWWISGLVGVLVVGGCSNVARHYEGWYCDTDADCLDDYVCDPVSSVCVGCIDHDADDYGQGPQCIGADCDDTVATATLDCSSITHTPTVDCTSSTCVDADGDGVGDGTCSNSGCVIAVIDSNDADNHLCSNIDSDACDDCTIGVWDTVHDGQSGSDCGGVIVPGIDTDSDGVEDSVDLDPNDPAICRDQDQDSCDDCSVTRAPPSTANDGTDSDDDGICDRYHWYNMAWAYRRPITLASSQVAETLTNFPVAIAIVDAAVGAAALASGDDLVFTAGDGRTVLNWELEAWSSGTGALVAWVNVPTLSNTTDTVIYLYYGNSAAVSQENAVNVWDASYVGVWHLAEAPSASSAAILDSTAQHNNGTAQSTMTGANRVAAKFGFGTQFDGADDYLNMGSGASLDSPGLDPLTIEGWMNATGAGENSNPRLCSKSAAADSDGLSLSLRSGTGEDYIWFRRQRDGTDFAASTPDSSVVYNTWVHVVAVFDRANGVGEVWIDGVQRVSSPTVGTSSLTGDSAYDFLLGNRLNGDRSFVGVLDEWRVSKARRSAAWITTSFNNQKNLGDNPTPFHTVGGVEPRPN